MNPNEYQKIRFGVEENPFTGQSNHKNTVISFLEKIIENLY